MDIGKATHFNRMYFIQIKIISLFSQVVMKELQHDGRNNKYTSYDRLEENKTKTYQSHHTTFDQLN